MLSIEVSLLLFAEAESPEELQKMLDVVSEYSRLYRFRFNRDKSNVMVFGAKKVANKFYLGKEELEIVNI